jgi:hypothetical protein
MKNRFLFITPIILITLSLATTCEAKKKQPSTKEILNKLNRGPQSSTICEASPHTDPTSEFHSAEIPEGKTDPWQWLNAMVSYSLINQNLQSKMLMQMEGFGEGEKNAYEYYLADLPYGKCRLKIDTMIRPKTSEDQLPRHLNVAIKEFKSLEIVRRKSDCKGSDDECQEVIAEKYLKNKDYSVLNQENIQPKFLDPIIEKRAEIERLCKPEKN